MGLREPAQQSFGEWLRQSRRALDLTQEELAQKVGCSASTLRKLESEARRPSKQIAERLTEVLRVPPGERADFLRFARGDPFAAGTFFRAPSDSAPAANKPPGQPTAPEQRHNLPLQLTSFIGRERVLAAVQRLLASERLLTLTGVGGTGKTRLALQVAAGRVDQFGDGVWLVELAALSDPALVPSQVASTLGRHDEPGRPISETLVDYLRGKNLLLILDNCEHLIEACSQLAHAILQACPRVHVLATSREGLGIAGETLYPVPSLGLPAEAAPLENLVASESGRLFVARARAGAPHFDATAENAGAVAQICRRLDGIPLALELAAARVQVLAPEQIAARLDDRFRLLTGGNRAALERHQTLRAAVAWSYALLAPAERQLLERAAVFDGGWTLEAAEAVCSGNGLEPDTVLDLLAGLASKSLVLVESSGPAARYRMLETIRQFAYEKLADSGDVERVRQRHLDFYVALATEAEPQLLRREQAAWIERLDSELPNIRAADDWAAARADGRSAVTLAGRLIRYWANRGFWREADARFTRALGLPGAADAPAKVRPAALHGAGQFAKVLEDYERAQRLLQESLALSQAEGDQEWAGWSLLILGDVALRSAGDMAAMQRYIDRGLAVFSAIGDQAGIAIALYRQSWAAGIENDLPAAEMYAVQSLAILRELGDEEQVRELQQLRGDIARSRGDLGLALECYEEALVLGRKLHTSQDPIASSYNGLGYVALRQGLHAEARAYFQDSLRLLKERELLDKSLARGFAKGLAGLGGVAAATGLPVKAARLFGAAVAQTRGKAYNQFDQTELDRDTALARAQLDAARFDTAWAEGQAMTLEQAVAFALGDEPQEPSIAV